MGNIAEGTRHGLPEGTVTFLSTDIEGSTQLLHQLGDTYATLLVNQQQILRNVFDKWNGREVDTQGDSFFVSFLRATEAVKAAVEIQRALAEYPWPQGVIVQVRMGLHTGEPLTAGEGYVGMDVHRAARIAQVGHGGQVLLSETTTPLVIGELPKGVSLKNLGRHRLKDIARPEHIHQLVIKGLVTEFPSLKSLEALGPESETEKPVRLPEFLEEEGVDKALPVFVGRESELAELDRALDLAMENQSSIFFIAGDAGSGKTTLLEAFSQAAQTVHSDLLVARGTASAFTGSGDPYAPFRSLLRELTGDVERAWRAGTISKGNALRLWSGLPAAAQAIVAYGPDLIGTFVNGDSLVKRVTAAAPAEGSLLKEIKSIVGRDKADPGSLEQQRLFGEVCDVLVELSAEKPLLLLLDDMQWADSASIDLLFYLERSLSGARVLLVCAYRPEDVALGRAGEQHPLAPVLSEMKRLRGDAWLDLGQASSRHFVDEYVDSEPNHFGSNFRKKLYDRTAGHALFTVELLRDMQERGELYLDKAGYWRERARLDWDTLPSRLEGVIEARIGRLEEDLRDILTVASVEGEDFTAQVIAQVQEVQERKLLHTLSRELEKQHKLVREGETVKVGPKLLSRYRFAHALFQRYLYNDLSAGERCLLHGEIGSILEGLYADRLDEITVQLGQHFAEANDPEKAIPYLLKAADNARLSFALKEAAGLYSRALFCQQELADKAGVAKTLMKIGLIYQNMLDFQKSRDVFKQAFEWNQQAVKEQTPVLRPVDGCLTNFNFNSTVHRDEVPDHGTHNSAFLAQFSNILFGGLVKSDINGIDVLPHFAENWDIREQGQQYVFRLRGGLRWSDGMPLTAGDFEFAWKRVLDPATQSINANLLFDIKNAEKYHLGEISDPALVGIRARDQKTLVIDLEGPTGYFLQLLVVPATFPVPEHTVRRHGDGWNDFANVVSCGPFCVDKNSPKGKMIFLTNPNFSLPRKGNVGRIEFDRTTAQDEAGWQRLLRQIVALYEKDRVSYLNLNLRSQDMDILLQKHQEDYQQAPFATTRALFLNAHRPPLTDHRVRKALVMALNRETIATDIYHGLHHPAHGGFLPAGIPGHSEDIGLKYNPDKARGLLVEAGLELGRDPTEIIIGAMYKNRQIDYLAETWEGELGLKIRYEKYLGDFPNPYHIGLIGWTNDYPDPDNFLRSNPYAARAGGRRQVEYDRLVETAGRTMDQEERIGLYKQADRILVEEAVIIPIAYEVRHRLVKPWFKNFVGPLFELGSWEDFIVEPH